MSNSAVVVIRTDIFAECSIDYTKDSEVAYHFY